jgi:hypothetical protein
VNGEALAHWGLWREMKNPLNERLSIPDYFNQQELNRRNKTDRHYHVQVIRNFIIE